MNKERLKKTLLFVIVLFVVAVIYYIVNRLTGIGLPCIYHEILHLNCPGCGISRMFFSMMELDFYQAFRYNPLMFILFPFGLFILFDLLIAYLYERPTKFFRRISKFII